MKKNIKGFTIVELIAVITILGVIMLIAVPNVIGILDKNRKEIYITDAKQMLTAAEYKFRSAKKDVPSKIGESEAIVFHLACLDTDLEEGPYGNNYNEQDSYVLIGNHNNTYYYYVTIQEQVDEIYRGIELIERNNLIGSNASLKVDDNFNKINILLGQTITTNDSRSYKIVYNCEND